MRKSSTDLHWDQRAITESDDARVNIHDTVQRDLELEFIFSHLPRSGRILEIGCGNGYVTQQLRGRIEHVDAFDFSENMIERARSVYGECNNRFFHGSVIDSAACTPETYAAAVCTRVLINLRDLREQAIALANIACWLRPGGKLVLVEGFRDGFSALNRLRRGIDLPDIIPAAINFYSALAELEPFIDSQFDVVARFHTGMFDFLTRIIYPRLVGPDQVDTVGEFHHKIAAVAQRFNPPDMEPLARVRGFALVKRDKSPVRDEIA
ncbi:MAG: class I SAM-dependent methyltransferase [Alphaproteobacteria bacterium]|nr:class I SAM-dependent methyltransferase [Alphaproteobacteria bacterium]